MAKNKEVEEWRVATNGEPGIYPSGRRYNGAVINSTCLAMNERASGILETTGKERKGVKSEPTMEEVEQGTVIAVKDGGYKEVQNNKEISK